MQVGVDEASVLDVDNECFETMDGLKDSIVESCRLICTDQLSRELIGDET